MTRPPQTGAPQTGAPQIPAPQTGAPQTGAPQTGAAQAAAPARQPGPQGAGMARWMAGGMPTEKALNFRASTLRLLRNFRPEWSIIATLLGFGVTSVVLMVLGPKILGRATDIIFAGVLGQRLPPGMSKEAAIEALRARGSTTQANMLTAVDFVPGQGVDFAALGRVLMLAVVVYVVASLLGLWQGRLTTVVVQRGVYRLREQVEAKLSRLPLSYFDGQQRGEVLSRATNDTDNIAQTLQQTFSQILTSLLMIVGVLIMMIVISPLLALIALVTVPVSIVVATVIGKRAQPQFIRQWATTGKLNGHIEEMFTGHSVVRAFGRQAEARQAFHEHNDRLYGSAFRAQFISGLIQPAMMFIGNLNYVLVAVIGGLRVASGSISLGDVQAFIQYTRQFSQPIMQVASMANLLQSGIASAERVFHLLDEPEQAPDPSPAPSQPPAPNQPPVRGSVAFENVSFRYEPQRPLIEGLSLTAQPGDTVAIVGPTGAGKTTLVNLLMRFYDVSGGRITLDGVDIATMPREQLRRNIGMVLQDTWLFHGTIAENISYGVDSAGDDDVLTASRAAHVDRFVRTLPNGYATIIDDEGSGVSAGERQLITIARAFLIDPAILILDEATSSVDTRTEVLIQRAMASLRAGRTSFVIAHRLSTIREADTILVMESGRIVEQGTHESLLAADGAYARLYAAQFASAMVDVDAD